MEEEDILVKIEDESAETPDVDAATEELRTQVKEAEAARKRAEQEVAAERARSAEQARAAETWRQQATVARSTVADTELRSIVSGIEAAETAAEIASQAIVAAKEKADSAAEALAYRQLAKAEARLELLSAAKGEMETRAKQPPPQPQPADPVEQFISRASQQSAQWLRAHRDWVSDPTKYRQLERAHFHAVGEEIEPDTPEYFEHIETRLGLREKPVSRERDDSGRFTAKQEPANEAPRRKAAPPPTAPVNGAGTMSVSSTNNQVTLSKRERDAANDGTHTWSKYDLDAGRIKDKSLIGKPIGTQEFARRKLTMQREGRYDRSYTDQ